MKRQIITGLGLSLAAVLLSSQAFADINTTGTWDDDGTTQVTYTVPSSYTVVIPASLAITAVDDYVGAANNVFISTHLQLAASDKVKVTMPVQTFAAVNGGSTMPFTVSYQANDAGAAIETSDLTGEVILLEKSGSDISGITSEDADGAVTGNAALSATVKAKATAAQITAANVSGVHTGTIQFAVTKTPAPPA